MSDKISILDCKTSITIVPKEKIINSIIKDLFMFVVLAFLIYISQGSTWWTFVTGCMFLFSLFVRVDKLIREHTSTFKDFDEAIKFLELKKKNMEKGE